MSGYGEELYGGGTYGGSPSSDVGDGWLVLAGAIVDTVAEGPAFYTDEDGEIVSAPGVFVQPLTLFLVDTAALDVVLSPLDETFARSFTDQSNDTGSGTFTFQGTDTSILGVIELDQLVNYYVYGNLAFTLIVEAMHKIARTAGEEHDQVVVVNGRGHLALWEAAVMYPSRGVDSLPIEEDRVFNWTSLDYDDSGWGYAKQISRQDQSLGATWGEGVFGGPDPQNWAETPGDVTAFWIWDHSGTQVWARPGKCYFRKFFTVPAGVTQIAIYFAMDNAGKIYVDGIPFSEQPVSHGNFNTSYVTIDVTQGTHLIAVEAENVPSPGISLAPAPTVPVSHTVVAGDTLWAIAQRYYGNGSAWRTIYDANQAQIQADAEAAGLWNPLDPGHWIFPGQVFTLPGINRPATGDYYNPGGFIAAVYTFGASGPETLITHTDSSWKIVGYPAEPPGMTPGTVLRLAKQEAKDRGSDLGNWTLKFTDLVDSAGRPWPVVADIATKVGTSYLTFLLELTTKYIDVRAAPGTKDLYAWVKGTRGSVRPVSLHGPTDTNDPESGNLYELAHTRLT